MASPNIPSIYLTYSMVRALHFVKPVKTLNTPPHEGFFYSAKELNNVLL